jgi:hypothetical protein
MRSLVKKITSLAPSTIDILVNLDGEHCQAKFCIFGEKEYKKLKALDGKMYFIVKH